MIRKSKNKWLKRSMIAVVVFALLIASAAGYLYYLQKKGHMKTLLIEEVNRHLNTQVQASRVDFTFFRHFPYASLVLKNIRIQDPLRPDEYLLNAELLTLKFNPLQLIRGNYTLRNGSIENATLELYINSLGKQNFQVIKASDGESKSFLLDMRSIRLENIQLEYLDERFNQQYKVLVHHSIARGSVTDLETSFQLKGELLSEQLVFDQDTMFVNTLVEVESGIDVNTTGHFVRFRDARVHFLDSRVHADGTINYFKLETMELNINSPSAYLSDLLSVLPQKYNPIPPLYEASCRFDFKSSLQGSYTALDSLIIKMDFNIHEGSVDHQQYGKLFEQVIMNGQLSRNPDVAIVRIPEFRLTKGQNYVAGDIQTYNLKSGRVQGHLDAVLQIEEYLPLLVPDSSVLIGGKTETHLDFNELYLRQQIPNPVLLGEIRWSEGYLKLRDENIAVNEILADLKLNKENWIVQSLQGISNIGDFRIQGTLTHIIRALLDPKSEGYADLTVSSSGIDLNTFEVNQKGSGANAPEFPSNVTIHSNLNIDRLNIQKFKAEKIRAEMLVHAGQMHINQIDLNAVQGKLSGELILEKQKDQNYRFYTLSTVKHADVQSFFNSFDNFGQEEITSQQLSGHIDADIEASGTLDQLFNPLFPSLQANAKMTLTEGRLRNHSTLDELSRFILLDDLTDIRFQKLENTISIKDGLIVIPEMFINTNTYDMWLSGEHSFENEIDYHLKIGLNQFLSSKAKRKKENSLHAEEQNQGMNLFVRISGTTSNPVFSYDSKNAREQLQKNLKTEKNLLDDIIREEIGWKRKKQDTIKNSSRHFEIEWEDE